MPWVSGVSAIVFLLVAVTFSTFFSKVRVTFISMSGLHFRVREGSNIASDVVSCFLHGPGGFVSAVLINGGVTLIVCNVLVTRVVRIGLLTKVVSGRFMVILIRAMVSALVVLMANRFLPGALFGVGPGLVLEMYTVPLFVYCIVLFPISGFTSKLSCLFLQVFKVGMGGRTSTGTFNGISLSCFVRSDVRGTRDRRRLSTRMGVFRGTLSFSGVGVHSYVMPHARIMTMSLVAALRRLGYLFIRSNVSGVVMCSKGVSGIIKCVRSSRVFEGPIS